MYLHIYISITYLWIDYVVFSATKAAVADVAWFIAIQSYTYMYVYIYIQYICICIYIYVYVYVYICVCMMLYFLYIYMCVWIYIYIWCDVAPIISVIYNIEYMMVCIHMFAIGIHWFGLSTSDRLLQKDAPFLGKIRKGYHPHKCYAGFQWYSNDILICPDMKNWYALLICLLVTNWFINHEISKLLGIYHHFFMLVNQSFFMPRY